MCLSYSKVAAVVTSRTLTTVYLAVRRRPSRLIAYLRKRFLAPRNAEFGNLLLDKKVGQLPFTCALNQSTAAHLHGILEYLW